MNRNTTTRLGISVLCICLLSSTSYAQGDNNPDPLVNLALIDGAAVTGSVANDQARGIPQDILWDPSTNDWASPSDWHEYGMAFDSMMAATEDDPFYWQVEWSTAKNINYLTVTGCYASQSQPITGWAIQIDSAGTWKNLAKSDNGWPADTLKGIGGWVDNGLLELRLIQPVVTRKIRFCAYANPDSLADGIVNSSDSLWSMVFSGRKMAAESPNACLIQYLDYSQAQVTNKMTDTINLALLDEAVVSSLFDYQEIRNLRGHPTDMLWDPATGDFHNPNTSWGEFGMPYGYDAGYLTQDDPYYWMVEWPVPKNINYFTWGGGYGGWPQPYPWAVEYWDGSAWVEAASGVGTDRNAGTWLYDSKSNPYVFDGLGIDYKTNSTWTSDPPIQTKKIRLTVWSDGLDPVFSFHIRGRGGHTKNWDERIWVRNYDPEGCMVVDLGADPILSTFKAMLVQYRDLTALAVEADRAKTPVKFALHQNYPNPFNPVTKIEYDLPKAGNVRIEVYNTLGQRVETLLNKKMKAGHYEVEFNAGNLSSGIYFYRIEAGEFQDIKKMIVIK